MDQLRSARVFRFLFSLFLILGFIVLNSSCWLSRGNEIVQKEAFGIMDTDVIIKAYGRGAAKAIDKAIEEMKRLAHLFDAYSPESDVSKVNESAGRAPVKVSPEVFSVVQRALYFSALTDGAFDPTVFPLTRLWGFGTNEKRVPEPEEIESVIELVDYRKVVLNETESTVFLQEKGMAIDLGAIAKGYAVGKMVDVMRKEGVVNFLINAGGNVYAAGKRPDGMPWRVAVTDPIDPTHYLGVAEASDLSLVSSGDYERYFEVDGQRYHHILDPKTGYPAKKNHGTTVFLSSSQDADALSTSLFILGHDSSEELLSHFPGIGVIFVEIDGNLVSQGIVDKFEFN
jgi:thiamine biosynthesis lipoprotein